MSKVRVAGFGISLDGFGAGVEQSLDDPLGKRGPELSQWFFHTRTFRAMQGKEGGSTDADDAFGRRSMEDLALHPRPQHVRSCPRPMAGRFVEGMVGPNPPYHAPTFILTHYEREPLVMEAGRPSTLSAAESKRH